jgi:hypothetical protein
MEFLLPKDQLQGLSAEDQKAAKDEAFNQFLLGSIFGGGGISTGYQAVQNIIPNMQKTRQQQGLLQELGAINKEFFPTPEQEQAQALNANLGRPRTASSPYALGTALGVPQSNVQPQALQGEAPNYADLQTRLARLSLNPNAAPMISNLSSAFGAFKPNVVEGVAYDIRNRPTSVLQRADLKTGLTLGGDVQNGNVTFNAGSIPGFVNAQARNELPPLATGQERTFDRFNNVSGVRTAPGAYQSTQELEAAKAMGLASGQVERVRNPITGEMELKSRASILGAPMIGQGGARQGAGAVVEASPAQKTFDETADLTYKAFAKSSSEAAASSSGRKLAAQQLYDLSTRIDNNKLTGLQAGVYGYMNAIPGVGKLFEQDITDVTRMNQSIATAQLEKTAQQKGAASNLDAQVIARGYATLTDPATATRMLAAQEEALADKDAARDMFRESYRGDPAKIGSAWQKAPENQPIFEHPKFKQFLIEQITANPAKPVLPAGFTLVQGKSGKYGIKRPDGTVMPVGQ